MSETIRPRTVLAFDFGLSAIGVAAGQEVTGQAGELSPLPAQNGVPNWATTEALIQEWQPALLVVGLPLNMDGTESRMAHRARRFARTLEKRFRLPCEMMDERLSTGEARQQLAGSRKRSLDSAAARLVLESWFAGERRAPAGESAVSTDEAALAGRISQVQARIQRAAKAAGRAPETVQLLAVSKAQPAKALRAACRLNLSHFGENYLQEALEKMEALADLPLCWHFIGTIQSNKTRTIASRFDWVHSLDRPRIAQRLNDGRPAGLPPLSVCLQMKLGSEPRKSGAAPEALAELAAETALLPRLRLRGLMALPPPAAEPDAAARHFHRTAECFETLRREHPQMDTLSMGMSADLESAIREGATLLRIGTGIFGPRPGRQL